MAVTVNVKGVSKTFNEADEEMNRIINSLQRANAFTAVNELAYVTPVDTGRARSSWRLTKSAADKIDTKFNKSVVPAMLGPIPSDRIESLYITNGTPYIVNLNAGSSMQAPSRFIENTLKRYFKITAGSVKFT